MPHSVDLKMLFQVIWSDEEEKFLIEYAKNESASYKMNPVVWIAARSNFFHASKLHCKICVTG